MKKTIVITGATSGIGQQTAITLAKLGYQVVVTGRDVARGEQGLKEIKQASGSEDVHLALGDLSHRNGVLALVKDLRTRYPRIDVFINNAGAYSSTLVHTPDGLELDFAVNVAMPYGLVYGLLPSLVAAQKARVVLVTGGSERTKLDPNNLQSEKGFSGLDAYSRSKRALDALSIPLARSLKPRGVFVNVVYPGQALTTMTRSVAPESLPWWMRTLWHYVIVRRADDEGKSALKASRSSVFAASSADLEGVSGRYYDTNCRPAKFNPTILNPLHQQQVLESVQVVWPEFNNPGSPLP